MQPLFEAGIKESVQLPLYRLLVVLTGPCSRPNAMSVSIKLWTLRYKMVTNADHVINGARGKYSR